MRQKRHIIAVCLLILVIGRVVSCSSSESSDIFIGRQSNSECDRSTRGLDAKETPVLKLTRDGDNIRAVLQNYEVYCIYDDLKVTCEAEDKLINIKLSDLEPTDCKCRINIYFTIYNAWENSYQLSLNGKLLGMISFQDSQVVQINLDTLNQIVTNR